MKRLIALAACAAAFSVAAGAARASDPIPGVDVKLGKNPGGSPQATTSGDDSPASVQTDESVSIAINSESREELGRLSLPDATVGVLSNTVLSGAITGNWTGDDSADMAQKDTTRDTRIETGAASVDVSAPGVANILQNTGLLTLQQGVVSMPVSATISN